MTRNPFLAKQFPPSLYRGGEVVATFEYDEGPLDLAKQFGREARLLLEIGPGRGHFLLETARQRPEWNLLAVEITRKRCWKLSRRAARQELDNLLVLNAVAEIAADRLLPPGGAREIHVHHPDPWPKKRHHKRRLLGPAFASKLARLLAPGGRLCVMTDHLEYAEEALEALEAVEELENLAGPGRFAAAPREPLSYYHRQCLGEGCKVAYLRMRRSGSRAERRSDAAVEGPGVGSTDPRRLC